MFLVKARRLNQYQEIAKELFSKAEWTAQDWLQLQQVVENQTPAQLQVIFEEDFLLQLQQKETLPSVKAEALLQLIRERSGIQEQNSKVISLPQRNIWKRFAVAASIIGVVFVGYWLMKDKTADDGQQTIVENKIQDVPAPDKNRAQIKLADGTIVYLDSATNGSLATQSNVVVTKTADGQIVYNRESSVVSGELVYNTLSNPRGSKVIDMTLSDGSRVWLNAGSSVTYPVAFVGNERKVEITGEAYFEVNGQRSTVDGKKIPFIVSKGDVSVTVLGTHFNVKAYDDEEDIKVTLLEGLVKVSNNKNSLTIKPNQQAVVRSGTDVALSSSVDVEQVMAWKNGLFFFKDASIETIMNELARWYDLEVKYEAKINQHYVGKIYRSSNASEVLKMLEVVGGVHFRIEGNTVVVMK